MLFSSVKLYKSLALDFDFLTFLLVGILVRCL